MVRGSKTLVWLGLTESCLVAMARGQSGFGGGSSVDDVLDDLGFGGQADSGVADGSHFGPNHFGKGQGNPNRFGGGRGGGGGGRGRGGNLGNGDSNFRFPPSMAPPSPDNSLVMPTLTTDQPDPTTTSTTTSTISTSAFVAPTSAASASSEAPSTTQGLAGIPLTAPTIVSSTSAESASSTSDSLTSTVSLRSTITTSMTLVITPSPIPDTAAPAEDSQVSAEATIAPTDSGAPLSSAVGSTSSPSSTISKQAGIGIGIAFGVLILGAAIGIWLWRRRRSAFTHHDSSRFNMGGFLARFRRPAPPAHDTKTDTEWSIESASKVEILRGGSIRSVMTRGSRPHSRVSSLRIPPSNELNRSSSNYGSTLSPRRSTFVSEKETVGESVGLGVLKVGMRYPDQKLALTSNPISPLHFPIPPSTPSLRERENKERTSSWPLPE